MKSKKILGLLLVITLLSASVFGSINVFAASGDTHVALESYMPPVKTLFVDDDFQNRAVGSTATEIAEGKTAYDKQAKTAQAGVNAAQTDTNIYAQYDATSKRIDLCDKVISTSANNLVISFKINFKDVDVSQIAGTKQAYFLLRFGNANSTKGFMFQEGTNSKVLIKKYYGDGSSTDTLISNISTDDWIDIAIVLEKGTDSAVLKKFFVNGSNVDITGKTVEFPADCNWWKATEASNESINAINIQNSPLTGMKVDDILVYEPQTVYFKDVTQTGLTIVNDSSASVTGNLFLALYDTDGNLLAASPYDSGVTVAAGSSQTITAPTGITYPEGIAKAKIFYWNGTTLAPICYAAEMSISIS